VAKKSKKRRKTLKKKSSSKKLTSAKPENYFILVSGAPLKNLKELVNALGTMNDWVFRHHVNESRNDFANWIKDVLKENELAEEIQNVRSIQDMEYKMLKYMVNKYT